MGFVGSFQERHAIHVLIQAVAEVKSRHPNTKLLAVGDEPLRGELVDLSARLGLADSVIFPGIVPHGDVPLYTSACDLFAAVVDPRWPSNPIRVYEYLASGGPVVTSERPELMFIGEHSLGRLVQGSVETVFSSPAGSDRWVTPGSRNGPTVVRWGTFNSLDREPLLNWGVSYTTSSGLRARKITRHPPARRGSSAS